MCGLDVIDHILWFRVDHQVDVKAMFGVNLVKMHFW